MPADLKSIIVQTRLGNSIKNAQSETITFYEQKDFERIFRKWSGVVQFRCTPSAIYNCHGLTFASKRTRIYDDDDIRRILQEDLYQEIELKDTLPGDIIVYFASDGAVDHSGIVVKAPHKDNWNLPVILRTYL